jgi:hypothetical protein
VDLASTIFLCTYTYKDNSNNNNNRPNTSTPSLTILFIKQCDWQSGLPECNERWLEITVGIEQSFLTSQKSLTWAVTNLPSMAPDGSLPWLQNPTTGPQCEPPNPVYMFIHYLRSVLLGNGSSISDMAKLFSTPQRPDRLRPTQRRIQ